MIKLRRNSVRWTGDAFYDFFLEEPRRETIADKILSAHNSGGETKLKLRFDTLVSHDITYVNIIQTAKACGLEKFPLPYVLTNCHNSLCAVGGTINEDDHLFGLSAAMKYGGIYVPPHLAVLHSFMREEFAGCGKLILGSDSHTRYGALGTLGIGEGGGELVKQLIGQSYDLARPDVIAVHLTGEPRPGVGPQDVALAIIGAVFQNGFVKNKIMEFVGDGIKKLPMDFRAGIDVMTTETACLSSIWQSDETVQAFLTEHQRPEAYAPLAPDEGAIYEGLIEVNLSEIEPMIALPFHPSNVFTIREFNASAGDILREVEKNAAKSGIKLKLTDKLSFGRVKADQAVIAGCAGGTFDNICAAAAILAGSEGFCETPLAVYPGSQPVLLELTRNGTAASLIEHGAVLRTAFCGPCFGAGDVPANNCLSIRHSTRNFPNREGAKPSEGQGAGVALMDARSIAATVLNEGFITAARESPPPKAYHFDPAPYTARVFKGWGQAKPDTELHYGPNISDWPEIPPLDSSLLIKIVSFITDEVTTTDELLPSGETSSYRSNPEKLADFTLSRKDPGYVARAKAVRDAALTYDPEDDDKSKHSIAEAELDKIFRKIEIFNRGYNLEKPQIGSAIFAKKPGDGSAREQAASCQKVLGGLANFANEYATKRYRSNLINWGLIPFVVKNEPVFKNGDYIYIRELDLDAPECNAFVLNAKSNEIDVCNLVVPELTAEEKEIIRAGCLINYNKGKKKKHV